MGTSADVARPAVGELPGWVPRRVAELLVVDERGCWVWQGERNEKGYGIVVVKLRRTRVHRYVWRCSGRALTSDDTLDHLCRVTACANPAHLEPVPMLVNVEREWVDRRIEKAWAEGGTW